MNKFLVFTIAWVMAAPEQAITAAQPGLAEFRHELGIITAASYVTFPTVNIREIEHWMVRHPDGVIAVGQVVRFERGESRESLAASLAYREQHARFVRNKQRLCDSINGEIRSLHGQIQRHANHLRSAAQAGFQGGSALMEQLTQKRDSLRPVLSSELEHYNQMRADHEKITAPSIASYSRLIDAYARAVTIIEHARISELDEICSVLDSAAVEEGGYTEAVLLAYATVRSGRDASQLPRVLRIAGQRLSSSESLGLSIISLNRIALSILCDTGEDVQPAIRTIKSSRDVTKMPAALYSIGTWYAAKGNWREAARYFSMTRAKVKDDARNRAIASADALYALWRQGKFDTPSDSQELVDDVRSLPQVEDNDAAGDWQILRGLAVVALTDGDPAAAARYVQLAIECSPPLVRKELLGLEDVFAGRRQLEVGYSGRPERSFAISGRSESLNGF